jgi:hypothetical protein
MHAFQAIKTHYLGPTNTKGGRIVAKADAGRIVMPYKHELSILGNHVAAAKQLAEKLDWSGTWIPGSLWRGTRSGYVFVSSDGEGFST